MRPRKLNRKQTIEYYLKHSEIVNKNGCIKVKKEYLNTYNGSTKEHRYLYLKFKGKSWSLPRLIITEREGDDVIIPGIVTRHLCHNPWCVNPEHLTYGTHQDNSNDQVKANRQTKGEKNPAAKLTEKQVKEIKTKIKQKITLTQIAKEYKVSIPNIYYIKQNKQWQMV